jgi:hypothetical protein
VINCYGHLAHAYELAYFRNGRKLSRKLFMTWLPGPNVIKLFTSVIYECLKYARLSVPGSPFQSSLMSGAYPRLEHLLGASLG